MPAVTPYPRRVQPAPPQSGSRAAPWPAHPPGGLPPAAGRRLSWRFRRKARFYPGARLLHHPLHRARHRHPPALSMPLPGRDRDSPYLDRTGFEEREEGSASMPVQTRIGACSRPQVGHRLPQGEIAGAPPAHRPPRSQKRRVNGERDQIGRAGAPCETILLDVILGTRG